MSASVLMVATGVVLLSPPEPAEAASASSFDPGFIVSDEVFFNGKDMTASQVQAFLNKVGSSCSNYTSGGNQYICMKNYSMKTADRPANAYCKAIGGASKETAAQIIAKVASACNIGAKVLLVTLQKEQGLVTGARTEGTYKFAMGYGCPDNPPGCKPEFAGFAYQVFRAAQQFQIYKMTDFGSFKPKRNNTILYHPNGAAKCGQSTVYIQNQATAGLYNYTPYQPNTALLSGKPNACSSYGNYNFYMIFSGWFGNPAGLLKNGGFESGSKNWKSGSKGAVTLTVRKDVTGAYAGLQYLEVGNKGVAGRWLRQEFSHKAKNGGMYAAGVWVKSAKAGVPVQGVLRAAALGNGTTYALTPFTAGDDWTYVTTQFAVNKKGMKKLRLSVQLNTVGTNLLVDGAAFYMEAAQQPRTKLAIKNASFEKSRSGWTAMGPAGVTSARKKSSAAKTGSYYFYARANKPDQSIRQRFAMKPQVGYSYTLGAWVMASSKTEPYTGRLRLATSVGTSESAITHFTVGHKWEYVTVTLEIKHDGHAALVPNFRLDTLGESLRIDGVTLTRNLMPGSSFEGDASEVWEPGGSSVISTSDGAEFGTVPLDGLQILHVVPNAGKPASVALSTRRILAKNETFTVTAWVRSAELGVPYEGRLALWGRGGVGAREYTETSFVAGDEWTKVQVSYTPPGPRTSLRVEFFLDTVDGTGLLIDRVQVQ